MEEKKYEELSEILNNNIDKIKETKSSKIIEDLIENLRITIENTSNLINDLSQSVDKIIKDDEIKLENKEIIKRIKEDFKNKVDTNFKYLISDSFKTKKGEEE